MFCFTSPDKSEMVEMVEMAEIIKEVEISCIS